MRFFLRNLLVVIISTIFLFGVTPKFALAGNPPDAGHSTLVPTTSGSGEVPADGTSAASLTLTLRDSSGIPLAGDSVTLSATSDSTIVFSPTTATLDATGIATFSATSTTAGTDSISVIDSTTGTTLTALGQVIFDALVTPTNTPTPTDTPTPTPGSDNNNSSSSSNNNSSSGPPSCGNSIPTGAPNLFEVDMGIDSATLSFAPPNTQFDSYTILYGLTSAANDYNATLSQGPSGGVVQYTVNDLTAGDKYYFSVRANNGCAPGPASSVLSGTTLYDGTQASSSGTLLLAAGSNLAIIVGVGGTLCSMIGFVLFKNPRLFLS
ncbi:MAG TPA: Ig-like domain-containing protein [Patescibacteria group bacterium]|nr:Ig-like domain-containing protein [Patescibacteria group bacterium]